MSGQKSNSIVFGTARGEGAEIAFNSSGGAAEWIMLMPAGAGGLIATVDGRGPYKISDAAALVRASLQAASGRLAVDENHATDLLAPNGGPSPARGWVVALESRVDGIFGKVEWSATGAALMAEKAYRYISPVFTHDKAGNVLGLLRASLTNTPNLRGMAALHSQDNGENDMDLLATLRGILGLDETADQARVIAAVRSQAASTSLASIAKAAGLKDDASAETVLATVTRLKSNAALASIAKAAGLKDDADEAAVVAAVAKLASGVPETITALQSELTATTAKLNTTLATIAVDKATAFVDGAIRDGRVGVKPMRDHYIARHAASSDGAAAVEKEIGALPKLSGGAVLPNEPPAPKDGSVALNASQEAVARLLGIKPEDYAKTLGAEAAATS